MNYIPFVVIYEPNQVKTILQSRHCLDKNLLYKFTHSIFGMGLLTVPASESVQNRKMIASSFSPIIFQEFFDTFVEQSLLLANKLEKVGLNGNKITFIEFIANCAMDIACDTMGIKIESDKKDQYIKAIMRFRKILKYRMYSTWILNDFLFYDCIFNWTTLGRKQQKILKLINSLTNEIIQQYETSKLRTRQKLTEAKTNTSYKTFFDNLMETFRKNNFTEKIIRDNVITLMVTASGKISITLDFVIFMLANFPEIQDKVYKELSEIYGTEMPTSAPIKYDDIQHMHYLDRVIKETMRLFPAIPITGRQLTKDMKIGKSILPKNSNIIISFIRMNRNEEYWPNPLKFDPDRFLPERIKNHHSYYHIPFSDGPRNCIGAKYAMISMKVILATLVRTFVFKVDESIEINKIKLQTDIILSTTEPLKVRIEKRGL
ncbi:PREDICTED: cytochrome P450 4C1-like isoform X2 [Wasmannia auropunctata]|nr:PREDICTED: cytochrome P450 4C1-like isoform X2 [Wasmannia auropunctata]XP_011690281.1 PREDICTED: cytochrome P450 4C1-like isoform X2 [Wasmannia auropunctata]